MTPYDVLEMAALVPAPVLRRAIVQAQTPWRYTV